VATSPDLRNANQHWILKKVAFDFHHKAEAYMLQNLAVEAPSFTQFRPSAVEMEQGTDPRLLSALRFIENNYSQPSLGLKDISQAAGLSVWYLSRIFNAEMRMGFREYLKNVRLQQARKLLNSSSLEIKAIAAIVGYTHLSDFYHHFKSECGMSPRMFRRNTHRAGLMSVSADGRKNSNCPTV
jgi:transcriptional regulator GlxA family with amidase domain